LEFDKINRGPKPPDIALTMENERRVFEPEKDEWIVHLLFVSSAFRYEGQIPYAS
jgi:hypothetical protein